MGGIEVHLYALVWNERPILPFFLDHYRPFVDKFYLFDDDSDDGSWEYLSNQQDVILERFESDGASFVEKARQFYCEAWKASRGSADFTRDCRDAGGSLAGQRVSSSALAPREARAAVAGPSNQSIGHDPRT